MKYPSEMLRKADEILADRRYRAGDDLKERREALRRDHPEVYAMYCEVNAQAAQMVRRVAGCGKEETESIFAEMMELSGDLTRALIGAGLEADHLSLRPFCPLCQDKGFVDNRSCDCRNMILNRMAHQWLSNASNADDCTFDNFRLDYYTGETVEIMEKVLTSCKRYAANFTTESPSLLFFGPPGLGKTHLSLAIAGKVVAGGHLVLYASAPGLLERLVDISFSKEGGDEYRQIAYGCELLIIDDLGAEFQTRFTRSEVYSLVNTRLIEGRPTIINTNLTAKELTLMYDERVASRLFNVYKVVPFTGKDIRYQRRMESMQRRTQDG